MALSSFCSDLCVMIKCNCSVGLRVTVLNSYDKI